jgi:ectoine hydroxylase-related dioxygenase (phytanoyl-CoA dioxygenase family)
MENSYQKLNLSNEQLASYQNQGFLVIENLLTETEVDSFVNYESDGDPPPEPRGLQNHKQDPHWAEIAHHPKITDVVKQLNGPKPQIVQSMYLDKDPNGGTGVAMHQDSHYIRNEPNTLMACWIALSHTDADNGGLCVVRGSNKDGLRPYEPVRNTEEHTSWERVYEMKDRNGNAWDETMHSFDITGLQEHEITRLEVSKGSAVFFTGMTIHGSFANNSQERPRRAFAVHYIQEETWIFRKDIQETQPIKEMNLS